MSFYLYSPESFPAHRKRNARFQDTPEYLSFNGFVVGDVKAGEWKKLQRKYERQEYSDFQDKRGTRIVVLEDEMADAINAQFSNPENPNYNRGVVVLDEATYADEATRKLAEEEAHEKNLEFRRRIVADFELQFNERQVTGKGRSYPTAYEEECYEVTGLTRPYSAKALEAQRNPGARVAQDIAAELSRSNMIQMQRLKDIRISKEEADQLNAQVDADKADDKTTEAVVISGTE